MERRWVCLAALAPIGVASLVYVVVVRGFIDIDNVSDHGLAWPLLGALPLFVFGMWLLTVSSSRVAVFIAMGATALLAGSAYETFVHTNPEVLAEPWFPLFNMIGLTADGVATSTLLIVFATFPDGVPDHLESKLLEGDAEDALVREAADAELLVVGSRGRTGLKSVLLGSVSRHVVSHAACPVVVVKPRPAAD